MLDILKLKLQIITNHHVHTGNQTWSFRRATSALDHWAISLASKLKFKIFQLSSQDYKNNLICLRIRNDWAW